MSSAPVTLADQDVRSNDRCASAKQGEVVIATLAREHGETGVHTHSRALLEGLSAAGLRCRLQTPFTGSPKWLPVFAVRRLLIHPLNKTWSTRWYRRWHHAALREQLIRDLKSRNTSALIAQCPVSASAALSARERVGGNFSVVMVCHFNHSEAREYRERGELADDRYFQEMLDFERSVLEQVDRVIYVSAWARRLVEQERAIHPRASSVIWNGICEAAPAQRLGRKDLGFEDDHLLLINVGTLEPRKNQVGLVDLFQKIASDFPSARLLLVGDGPSRKQVERRIDGHGLQDKVMLLGFRNDVEDLLGLSDLYVHYSSMENCPMVLIEAARAGLPIAAAATGGVPELLEQLGGIALDSSRPEESLAALRPVMQDARRRTEAGQFAQQSFHRRFTRDAMVGEYLHALGLTKNQKKASPT